MSHSPTSPPKISKSTLAPKAFPPKATSPPLSPSTTSPSALGRNSLAGAEDNPVIKFVLIGDNGVGKTNLALRFCKNRFDSSSAHTVGFEFRGRKLPITPSLTVNAQIWDTAGQERFQALTEQYLRGAVGIFIVYDVTSRKSFENLGSWLKKIDDTAHPNAVRSLIGNKSDMPAKREVTALQGLKLAQHHHMDFCEVSAASGLNVEVAMRRLIVTVSNSLIEQDERLSLPNLNIEELGLGIDMPSLDTPPRKQVKHVLQTKLPSGWVAETGSGTGGGYVNTWTGEIVTDRPTVTAGQGKIDYDRPKEDLEQIDISFADIKMMKKKKFSKKQLAADDGGKISFGLHGMLAKEADEGCAPNGCVLM